MVKEINDKEFDDIVADKRHKELLKSSEELLISLKEISKSLINNSDAEIAIALNNQGNKISELVKVILTNSKEINIEYPKEFVSLVNNMCKDILLSNSKVVESISNRLLPDTFSLVKDPSGITQFVKVNYLEASKITIKR